MPLPDCGDLIKLYEDAKTIRGPFEPDWRMAAAYCLPRHYSTWQGDGKPSNTGNEAVRRFAYDNTGVRSLPKFVAILNRLCTPEGQRWHVIRADNANLMKIHHVRTYFSELNDLLFKLRYDPRARFTQCIGETYSQIGVYGMGPNALTWRKPSLLDPRGGYSYKAWPLKDVFILTDDAGVVTHIFRRFWLNARQFKRKFKDEGAVPRSIKAELDKAAPSETTSFEFVHVMCENSDYDQGALDARRFPVLSVYIAVADKEYAGDRDGFMSFPMLTPRTDTEPNSIYGFSAAQRALPALGGVSAMKKTVLKQGQKAVDPTLLAFDDGVLSGRVDQRPGRVNYGGVNAAGKKLVQALETGDFRVAEQLIQDERMDIEDSFLVTVFRVLEENPNMTATAVVELAAQKSTLVAPTMGRLQSEQFGPQIEREITLGAEHGLLPEMPQELIEARGEYKVTYTSPMAKGLNAEEIAGFMRWMEMLLAYTQATQDPEPLDYINMNEAAPEVADFLAVRPNWVSDTKMVQMKRDRRSKQTQQQNMVDQAPAIASVVNTALRQNAGTPGATK